MARMLGKAPCDCPCTCRPDASEPLMMTYHDREKGTARTVDTRTGEVVATAKMAPAAHAAWRRRTE